MNLEALLPAGLSPEQVIIVMSALTAFVSFFAVWNALLHKDPAARRAEQMAVQREALRAGVAGTRRRRPERQQTLGFMRQVVERMNLMRSMQAEKITTNLARAGWRGKDAQIRYLFMKVALPFVFGGVAVFMTYGLGFANLDSMGNLIACAIAVLFGAYAPDIAIKNAVNKRQEKIRKSLPDALDLMVICAEAGLSLDATLMRVADEMSSAGPEMADEFSLTSLELGFLPDRQKALENLASRSNL
ncbi:MAG: type II secretion system F family protein, partial [Rhodospirillales bacterium]|nr:type II secretion system F family protein [Rhodospirillales bacterium]